jgi:GxxExxY protein
MRAGTGFARVPDDLNEISGAIVDSAIKVHKALGPGLLESTYRLCLVHELTRRGYRVEPELPIAVKFEGLSLDAGYRLDLLVNGEVIVELKAVEAICALHRAQLLSYLKHANKRLGLLINFNTVLLKDGLVRIVNG